MAARSPAKSGAERDARLAEALRKLDGIAIDEGPVEGGNAEDGKASYAGMFDWGDWQEALAEEVRQLMAALSGAPVRTEQAITFTGWQPQFACVWQPRLTEEATLVHWAAVDAQNNLRINILQGLASVLRISTDLLTGGIARNPVSAVRTGQALLENVRVVWSLLQSE